MGADRGCGDEGSGVASDALHHVDHAGVDARARPAQVDDEQRASPTRRALVIGDDDFVECLRGVASRRGHRIVDTWDPQRSGPVTPDSVVAEHDLLILQAERVVRLGDVLHAGAHGGRVIALTTADSRSPRARLFDSPLAPSARVFKRGVDVAVAGVALLVLWPIMLIAALLIKRDTRGGAIFSQTRVGADGRRFTCYKLRTMVADNDHSRHAEYVAALIDGRAVVPRGMYKLTSDPRITRIGRHLRRLSIDELPQLWNVMRGDMSIVGPRPSLPYEVELYDGTALQRLRVKPGLTGLWQVSGRCELTFAEMVALDIRYWRSWSPVLDLRIILRTPGAILRGRGAT
jgi:lipopolysaccharide/colanic/teichoic acid biosynthesis glycosyltransferase